MARLPIYENGSYWVAGDGDCYKVYEAGVTHSRCVAMIGFAGLAGLNRAKAEADQRASTKRVRDSTATLHCEAPQND